MEQKFGKMPISNTFLYEKVTLRQDWIANDPQGLRHMSRLSISMAERVGLLRVPLVYDFWIRYVAFVIQNVDLKCECPIFVNLKTCRFSTVEYGLRIAYLTGFLDNVSTLKCMHFTFPPAKTHVGDTIHTFEIQIKKSPNYYSELINFYRLSNVFV